MIILTQPKFSLPGVVLGCLIVFYVFLSSPLAAQGSSSMTEPSPVSGVNFRQITANGLDFRIAVAGDSGPLMLLAHGWPESWYNWRHQLSFFSQRGFRVVAPDMRGYGSTDAPDAVEAYDIKILAADMVGILDVLGESARLWSGTTGVDSCLEYRAHVSRSILRADCHERTLQWQTGAVAAGFMERSLCR